MAWTIPDKGEGDNDIQSRMAQEHLDILVAGISRLDYVVSGCAVTGGADMTPAVAAGVVRSNGVSLVVTGSDVTVTTADATNPRLDLVVVTSAGALAVRAGTAAAAPKPAARSANDVVLAVVYVPAGATAIASTQITDMRIIDAEAHAADTTAHGIIRANDAFWSVRGTSYGNMGGDYSESASVAGSNTPSTASARASHHYRYLDTGAGVNAVASALFGSGSVLGPLWLGNANNLGGFRYEAVFGLQSASATSHAMVGLKSAWGFYTSGSGAATINTIGIMYASGDANWSRINNDGSGSGTPVSLGSGYPVNTTAMYRLVIKCAPYSGGANPLVYCSLTNIGAGTTTSWTLQPGTDDMPANTVFLSGAAGICAGSGGGSSILALQNMKYWTGAQTR